MTASDRTAYAERQAQLLDALLRGDGYPQGFVCAQADAAGSSLRRKRANAVARAWPALALGLGDAFGSRFDAFARTADPPPFGGPLADGLRFARWLSAAGEQPGDDARVELLLARATLCRYPLFAGAAWLRRPYPRLLVAVRLPWARPVHRSYALRRRAG